MATGELRLVAPSGMILNLDTLIEVAEDRMNKAKAAQEAQRRVVEGARYADSSSFQKAVTEIGVEIGMEIAYRNMAEILKQTKDRLMEGDKS